MHFIVEQSKTKTLLPKIMRAAVRLFVEKGIDGTTTKDIAAKSGVSEGALYRHFKSKEDLAYHLFAVHVNDFTMDLATRVAEVSDFRQKVHAYITICFEAFETERDLFTYLILSEHRELDRYPETFKHPGHVAVDLVTAGQKAGVFQAGDPYIGGSILVGSIIRLCIARIRKAIEHDLRQEVNIVSESLWRALRK
jgi:AcrR family transcriptional regulator